jgi:aryl-alcohol dehydrogenase
MGVVEGDSNPPAFIPRLVELYRQGNLPLDKIIKTFKADQFAEAVKAMKAGQVRFTFWPRLRFF